MYFFQPEIIQRYGYPVEIYKVQTKDGYLLKMFRIPYGYRSHPSKSNQPIVVQHGLFSSCSPFVAVGNKSLGAVTWICNLFLMS